MMAFLLACSLSTLLANVWAHSYPDGIETIGLAKRAPQALSVYVWIYCESNRIEGKGCVSVKSPRVTRALDSKTAL